MKLATSAIALTFVSAVAFAAGMDANNDGRISAQELKPCDINGDRIVTRDEAKKCGMTDAQWKQFETDQRDQLYLIDVRAAGDGKVSIDKTGEIDRSGPVLKPCDINGDFIVTKAEAKKCGLTDAQWTQFEKTQRDQLYLLDAKAAGS